MNRKTIIVIVGGLVFLAWLIIKRTRSGVFFGDITNSPEFTAILGDDKKTVTESELEEVLNKRERAFLQKYEPDAVWTQNEDTKAWTRQEVSPYKYSDSGNPYVVLYGNWQTWFNFNFPADT